MDHNSFRTIPAEFLKALRNAEFLRFGDNGIECFPMSALGTLQFLGGIYLENNLIKTVDDIGHRGRRGFRIDVSGNTLVCDDRYICISVELFLRHST